MKVVDLSPIDQPAVGKIVSRPSAIDGLQDCCLYLFPSNSEGFNDMAKKVLTMLMEHMGKKNLLNAYTMDVLDSVKSQEIGAAFRYAIEEETPSFIMPLNMPSMSEKKYLLVKSSEGNLMKDIPLMLYTSERVSKQSMVDFILQFAVVNTETFIDKTGELWSDGMTNSMAAPQDRRIQPSFGSRASKGLVKKALGDKVEFTHKTKIDLQANIVETLNLYKEDTHNEKAYAKLKLFFESIPAEDLIRYVLSLSQEEQNRFKHSVSAEDIAQQSSLKIEVRRMRSNVQKPTDGHYGIFFKKGDKEKLVHFKRRSSFLLYLIHIFDVVKHEKVDTIDLKSYMPTFNNLFIDTYGYDDGTKYFKTLFGKGTSEQELLRHCHSDIKEAITNVCKELDESPSPYLVNDSTAHLHVLKKNIKIDEKLLKYF